MHPFPDRAGPFLYFRGWGDGRLALAALSLLPPGETPPPVQAGGREIAAVKLRELGEVTAWRHDFDLGPQDDGYGLGDSHYPVQTDLTGDLRIAFASCNGEENGDMDRAPEERNAMWERLGRNHDHAPFALLLQGGDQIYADEATHGHPLTEGWPGETPPDLDEAQQAEITEHLRAAFVQRYLGAMGSQAYGWLSARVPSLCVWDDHDICDGWGSLPRDHTSSTLGQTLFRVAREMYLLFQHAATEDDVATLFLDPQGRSLSWAHELPGLTLFAPDLRSERGRRHVMREAGWQSVEALEPQGDHVMMVSSVPLLGPRLSLLEGVMLMIPKIQQYEDDLRDQWQSRAHRTEWVRMLKQMLRLRKKAPVTVLSGEIHLATRAEMGRGPTLIHQLVASGIAHRAPPQAFARSLGTLAGLGASPIPDQKIRIHPLPGQKQRYMAERNFLVLERTGRDWQAVWHLEDSGPTPALPLT
ncbi:alkaline phosphatase D family protein [Fluviibacterium sp. S390]|uniref:alkaline phosphatase D family protein n=1 Tax=Fluviibacterium sp. S390 TaxID=3415139 RepID=UPI003C7CF330